MKDRFYKMVIPAAVAFGLGLQLGHPTETIPTPISQRDQDRETIKTLEDSLDRIDKLRQTCEDESEKNTSELYKTQKSLASCTSTVHALARETFHSQELEECHYKQTLAEAENQTYQSVAEIQSQTLDSLKASYKACETKNDKLTQTLTTLHKTCEDYLSKADQQIRDDLSKNKSRPLNPEIETINQEIQDELRSYQVDTHSSLP